MGLFSSASGVGTPEQHHDVHIANDVMWITGDLETMGNPHNYVNQDGLDFLMVQEPHVEPWGFTGLPSSHPPEVILYRERIQFLIFPKKEALEQYRRPPRTEQLIINLPLAVVYGAAPFLSEAKIHNFLDFWKGIFFPVMDAEIHYLADGPARLPAQSKLVYINRQIIQSYQQGS